MDNEFEKEREELNKNSSQPGNDDLGVQSAETGANDAIPEKTESHESDMNGDQAADQGNNATQYADTAAKQAEDKDVSEDEQAGTVKDGPEDTQDEAQADSVDEEAGEAKTEEAKTEGAETEGTETEGTETEPAELQDTDETASEASHETASEASEGSEGAEGAEGGEIVPAAPEKKGFIARLVEREKEKERMKLERYERSEENMRAIRERTKNEMFGNGNKPNKLQEFLMAEGKYINYENKQLIVLICAMIIGVIIVVFAATSGIITKEKFGLGKEASKAIVYSKDNELYCYDLKNEPVLISDNLSSGGSASYSYVGSGTTVAEDGKSVYFIDNVAADGSFSLNFYTAGKSAEPSLISDNVIDYEISYEGDGAVYVVEDPDTAETSLLSYSRSKGESFAIADTINSGSSNYAISSDGSKIIYVSDEDGTTKLNICGTDGSAGGTIDTDVAQYIATEKNNKIYYIKTVVGEDLTSSYSVYEYDIKKGQASLIDDNVITVALSAEENALIYYKFNGNTIKASDIVVDDGDDSDETKALRAEVAEYEFKDIACSVYRYEEGISELVNDKVFTAIPMDGEGKYIVYTVPQKLDEIKVNLSEISSVNEISALYYMEAMQADCDTYIYQQGGFNDYVVFEDSYIYSYANAGNDKQFACFVNYDDNTGVGKLILATYGENGVSSYGELEDDVTSFQFAGDGSRLAYMRDVQDDGSGTLLYVESNIVDEISDSAYYYEVADDYNRRVFYLDNYDSTTYGGTFGYYQQGKGEIVDDNVYMFAYRNNNNALYMKDYDILTGRGDLYYLNGGKAVLVDEDVSSVFDFYDMM